MIEQFIEFLDNIKSIGLEWYNKYYAVYPGVVEDTNDPEQRGRIKISLPSILDEDEIIENWCDPCGQPLAGDQTGQFMPPYVGDVVDVIFENGDINYPKYLGGFWAIDELHPDFADGYGEDGPMVRGWIFNSGQKILVDETTGALKVRIINGETGGFIVLDDTEGEEGIFLTHKSGSLMQISPEGNVTFATPSGNLVFLNEADGEITVKSSAGATVSAKENVTITDASGKNMISITDSSVEVSSSGDVIVSAQNVNLNAGNIALGGDADNVVLYSKLASIFDQHMHATALGPSGPPLPPSTFAITENAPPMSAKAGNIKCRGNL